MTKRGIFNVSWTRCCAPVSEGGFGVRSIRFANASFTYKLSWDIMKGIGPLRNLKEHYFHKDGSVRNFRWASSIWPSIHPHASRLYSSSRWLIGTRSEVDFWSDNWLGYRIIDRIQVPQHIRQTLCCKVGDYFVDGY